MYAFTPYWHTFFQVCFANLEEAGVTCRLGFGWLRIWRLDRGFRCGGFGLRFVSRSRLSRLVFPRRSLLPLHRIGPFHFLHGCELVSQIHVCSGEGSVWLTLFPLSLALGIATSQSLLYVNLLALLQLLDNLAQHTNPGFGSAGKCVEVPSERNHLYRHGADEHEYDDEKGSRVPFLGLGLLWHVPVDFLFTTSEWLWNQGLPEGRFRDRVCGAGTADNGPRQARV